MPLTHHCIATAHPREKLYALTDGHGLHLQVTPEGSKRWRFRYRFRRLAVRGILSTLRHFPLRYAPQLP